MRLNKCVFLFFVIFSSCVFGSYSVVETPNKFKAIVYLPEYYEPHKSYPVLTALHGMYESMYTSYRRWKTVADALDMILLCPEGSSRVNAYVRKSKDDMRSVTELFMMLDMTYNVNRQLSLLIGFSRGGNIALEMGVRFPDVFPNIISFFGFFERKNIERYYKKLPSVHFRRLRYFLITGHGDSTETSMKEAFDFFSNRNISVQLFRYLNLSHGLPKNLNEIIDFVINSLDERRSVIIDMNNTI